MCLGNGGNPLFFQCDWDDSPIERVRYVTISGIWDGIEYKIVEGIVLLNMVGYGMGWELE